jgi:hypothetical protein
MRKVTTVTEEQNFVHIAQRDETLVWQKSLFVKGQRLESQKLI